MYTIKDFNDDARLGIMHIKNALSKLVEEGGAEDFVNTRDEKIDILLLDVTVSFVRDKGKKLYPLCIDACLGSFLANKRASFSCFAEPNEKDGKYKWDMYSSDFIVRENDEEETTKELARQALEDKTNE